MKLPVSTHDLADRIFRSHRYFWIKLVRAAITSFLILVLSFFMIHSSGNPAQIFLGGEATPEMVAAFNVRWDLDRPLQIQFLSYLQQVAKGDLGNSLLRGEPVIDIFFTHLPATLSLMIPCALISITLGIALGFVAAMKKQTTIDHLMMIGSTIGYSLPNFFFGVLLIFIFSIVLGWLPSSGNETLAHYIMPVLTIVTADIAIFTRFSRSSFIDVYEHPYINNFKALGVSERRILLQEALPNASIALLSISGFYVGSLISGAIVTETIFSWPGIGSLLVSSMKARDFPLVQGLTLILGFSIVGVNLLVDILHGIIDPRIRKGGK